jgi:hypothetical protein
MESSTPPTTSVTHDKRSVKIRVTPPGQGVGRNRTTRTRALQLHFDDAGLDVGTNEDQVAAVGLDRWPHEVKQRVERLQSLARSWSVSSSIRPVCREFVARDAASVLDTMHFMEPDMHWDVDDINLSDMDFWRRPWAEREAAFALLRAEKPISHYDEPVIENTAIEFPKATVTTPSPDTATCRRRRATPRPTCPDRAPSRRWTCPPRWSSTSRA